MATGTVKWFNNKKGYGFICPDEGGNDIFVHITAVHQAGMKTLKENAKICTMDSEEDYVNLLTSRYRKVTKLYKDKQLLSVDWNFIAKDFDAFHLTKEGYLNLRSLSPVFYMGDRICVSDFSSYYCETWIIFNLNCIDENTIETICLNNG